MKPNQPSFTTYSIFSTYIIKWPKITLYKTFFVYLEKVGILVRGKKPNKCLKFIIAVHYFFKQYILTLYRITMILKYF